MPPFRRWLVRFLTSRKGLVILVGVVVVGASLLAFYGGALGRSLAGLTTVSDVCPPGQHPILVSGEGTKTIWACSIYGEEERARIAALNDQAQSALDSAGLWPDPGEGVSYDPERDEFTVEYTQQDAWAADLASRADNQAYVGRLLKEVAGRDVTFRKVIGTIQFAR